MESNGFESQLLLTFGIKFPRRQSATTDLGQVKNFTDGMEQKNMWGSKLVSGQKIGIMGSVEMVAQLQSFGNREH